MSTARLSTLNNEFKKLERRVSSLERVNQTLNLAFGNITLDGVNGLITVGVSGNIVIDGSNSTITAGDDEIVIDGVNGLITVGAGDRRLNMNNDGSITFITDTTSSYYPIIFYSNEISTELLGLINYRRYAGVSALNTLIFETAESNQTTFTGWAIHRNDQARRVFLETESAVVSGSFSKASLNFSYHGVYGALYVEIDSTSGTGHMRMPQRASDPSTAENGSMYYSTTSAKVRIKEGGTWKDVV